MSAINKTGVVRYNVTADTHNSPWGHRNSVNGDTIHFDLGDNTLGYHVGDLDYPETMSVQKDSNGNSIALYGNHDTAVNDGKLKGLQTYEDQANKVIFFGLDCGTSDVNILKIPDQQINSMADRMSKLAPDWDVVVLTHAPLFPDFLNVKDWDCGHCWTRPGDYQVSAEKVVSLLKAFNSRNSYGAYSFANATGYVIGCFAGHIHNPVKCIYQGIPMETFPTNGSDEWTKSKEGAFNNAGLYEPTLAYININFKDKTVNGTSYVGNGEKNEMKKVGDYHHAEDECLYMQEASCNFKMMESSNARPKFYDGVYIGYSYSILDGTAFGRNGRLDRYWPFGTMVNMNVGGSTITARSIWFDAKGLLR